MDCRATLGTALFLLTSTLGCQHNVATLDPSQSIPTAPVQLPVNPNTPVTKKVARKDPPPLVVVKLGDFKAGEAFAADIPPARQQQMREEARSEYVRALKIDSKYVPAYQGLARLYVAMQDHPRAVETYQKALKIAPKNASLWYELGMTHNYQKEWDPALRCLSQAASLEPENRDYVNTLGVVFARVGRYHESLDCFVRVGGEATGHYKLARTLQYLQQPELSRQHLDMALQMNPNLSSAQAMMGQTNDEANRAIQRTSYQEPSVPQAQVVPQTPVNVTATPLPRVIQLNPTPANVVQPEVPTEAQPILIPPPPAISLEFETPPEPDEQKP
jgi:tetratricopeptide (TPR) repeat protein